MNRRSSEGGGYGTCVRNATGVYCKCYEQEEAKKRADRKRTTAHNADVLAGTAPGRARGTSQTPAGSSGSRATVLQCGALRRAEAVAACAQIGRGSRPVLSSAPGSRSAKPPLRP